MRRRRSRSFTSYGGFAPYVPVAQRVREARAAVTKLKKTGQTVDPVEIDGRAIASTFWGKAWCTHLESLSDFQNRLPRGRTYVRRGAVIHLALDSGRILAKVQGSSLYDVEIGVSKLQPRRWTRVVAECTGSIDSLVELLRGELSKSVMQVVTNVETGLFPAASEIRMSCSCPDWAGLCKHLAAVLYGVGARLDTRPELLFTLRGVDPSELVAEGAAVAAPEAPGGGARARHRLSSDALSDVFGIELERVTPGRPSADPAAARPGRAKRMKAGPVRHRDEISSAAASGPPRGAAAGTRAAVPKRRSPGEVEERAARVLAFIEAHPGLGIERIGQSMNLGTRELSLPIKKLLVAGSIVTIGVKRATKYFAVSLPPRRRRQ